MAIKTIEDRLKRLRQRNDELTQYLQDAAIKGSSYNINEYVQTIQNEKNRLAGIILEFELLIAQIKSQKSS